MEEGRVFKFWPGRHIDQADSRSPASMPCLQKIVPDKTNTGAIFISLFTTVKDGILPRIGVRVEYITVIGQRASNEGSI